MWKKSFVVLSMLAGLTCSWGTAFIYEIKILRKPNIHRGGYHYVIGCSDFHDKKHSSNKAQAEDLEKMLEGTQHKKTIKMILEDLSSAGNSGHGGCGRFAVNSRGGVLGGLAQKCRDKGFDVNNVEYRYCRVSSLGPVLNNLHKKPHDFPSVKNTLVSALSLEVDAIVQELQGYKGNRALMSHYKHALQTIKPQLKKWKEKDLKQVSVADYVEKHSKLENRLEFLKYLLTFDSVLVDLKMMHAVVNAQKDFNCVIAIAGGAHISRVTDFLRLEGAYELVHETDVQFNKEYNLEKCLGSTIVDGTYCIRPEPIDLGVVKPYL